MFVIDVIAEWVYFLNLKLFFLGKVRGWLCEAVIKIGQLVPALKSSHCLVIFGYFTPKELLNIYTGVLLKCAECEKCEVPQKKSEFNCENWILLRCFLDSPKCLFFLVFFFLSLSWRRFESVECVVLLHTIRRVFFEQLLHIVL